MGPSCIAQNLSKFTFRGIAQNIYHFYKKNYYMVYAPIEIQTQNRQGGRNALNQLTYEGYLGVHIPNTLTQLR